MQILQGNLFDFIKPNIGIAVTTNGVLDKSNNLIMGKGIALEFKLRYPNIQTQLGTLVKLYGNNVYYIGTRYYYKQYIGKEPLYEQTGLDRLEEQVGLEDSIEEQVGLDIGIYYLISFPTKHHWKNPSDINLIKRSAYQLQNLQTRLGIKIYLPLPGCTNGGLNKNYVLNEIGPILSDNIIIVIREEK